jgi:hypothetical protein
LKAQCFQGFFVFSIAESKIFEEAEIGIFEGNSIKLEATNDKAAQVGKRKQEDLLA